MILLYLMVILIYFCAPLPFQLIIVIINTFLPDPLPFLDEMIMYLLTVGKMSKALDILDFGLDHPIVASFIIILLISLFIFGVVSLVNIII